MGDDVEARKHFIQTNAKDVTVPRHMSAKNAATRTVSHV